MPVEYSETEHLVEEYCKKYGIEIWGKQYKDLMKIVEVASTEVHMF